MPPHVELGIVDSRLIGASRSMLNVMSTYRGRQEETRIRKLELEATKECECKEIREGNSSQI